jgi:hypothetical protein
MRKGKMHPSLTHSGATTKPEKPAPAHPAPLCSTTSFLAGFSMGLLSQTVAICRNRCCAQKTPLLHVRTGFVVALLLKERVCLTSGFPKTRSLLAQRRARKPDTKAGQLWALWPEIKAALNDGQSVRTVLDSLKENAGIVVRRRLTSYISRIRRREATQRTAEAAR